LDIHHENAAGKKWKKHIPIPLDYESLPEQGIGLDGNLDSEEREEEKIITLE